MALYSVTAGDRILAADVNQFYNILKGVTGSGETTTLIYNAAGSLILQPSSNPAAGTELFQIKNAAGTVQSALSSDGRVYLADGTEALPSLAFESDKTNGFRLSAADSITAVTAAADRWTINASGHLLAVDDDTYDIGASGATRPRNLYISGDLTAGGAISGGALSGIAEMVRKTADETVNASTTLQDDDELLYALAANEVWAFSAQLLHIGNNTANIKFAFTVPALATIHWTIVGTSATGSLADSQIRASGTAQDALGHTLNRMDRINGLVVNGANAGNLQLQWAQNTSTAVDTKVVANSLLMLWRLA